MTIIALMSQCYLVTYINNFKRFDEHGYYWRNIIPNKCILFLFLYLSLEFRIKIIKKNQ